MSEDHEVSMVQDSQISNDKGQQDIESESDEVNPNQYMRHPD